MFKEGAELYKKLKLHFFDRKFNLRKWRTNDENLHAFIKEDLKTNVRYDVKTMTKTKSNMTIENMSKMKL